MKSADLKSLSLKLPEFKSSDLKSFNKFSVFSAFTALLVAVAVAASISCFRRIEQATTSRQHASQMLIQASDLLSALKDAETGQRGYLLTHDDSFLEPYLEVRHDIAAHVSNLNTITTISAAREHLDTVAPLIEARMTELARLIALRQANNIDEISAQLKQGHGKRLMDSIRGEMQAFNKIVQDFYTKQDVKLHANLRQMLRIIMLGSIAWALFALAFIYLIYRQSQQRLNNLVLLETQDLLAQQDKSNQELQQLNLTLHDSEEKLTVTLNSIGDAVITTDARARVTMLNPLAEKLTGWTQAEACGRQISEIFKIINNETRLAATIPVMTTLADGTIQGLANHTVLISRQGNECDIAESCAPIRGRDRQVVGAVLVFRNVTEEYAVQQALRDNTALIQTILNTVADGIITLRASNGMIGTVNPTALRMFGFEAAELSGRNFSELIPELDQEQRNGSLKHYSASEEARAVGLGREVIGWRKDNTSFPLEIVVSEMWTGGERYFTCILRDITTRKQAEESLLQAGALQNAIFNSANFSSIATDAHGVIQIFNVGAEHMLGYSAAEVINKITPAEISDPQEVITRAQVLSLELDTAIKPGFEALVFKASRGIEDIYELTYIRKDGSRFPALVSVTALRDAQDAIIGFLLIGTDNTVRKLVEAERTVLVQALQDKNAELEQATYIAEKANRAKSDFLSSMSHELRTPLGAILGFAQLIESGTPEPTAVQQKSIEQILKAGWYLLELINEVLDLALIESGKLSLSLEPVLLSDILQECEAMIETQAQQRGISISFEPVDNSYCVRGDRTRLKQVLINLLSNATKYNKHEGSVKVCCELTALNTIRISVHDTGPGLSAEDIEQLFQPFNRLGQKNNTEEGTGIGLVVSKRLINLMNGKIGVVSTVGSGSMFWIELDLAQLSESAELQSNTAVQTNATGLKAQLPDGRYVRSLLYIEDNPANLMLVEDIIARRPDIRLFSAKDGRQGIALALAMRPDIILMDINLPGISGIEALKILLNNEITAHTPILAVSANAMPRDIEKGLEAGFFRYLTKPIRVTEFMNTLNIALNSLSTAADAKTAVLTATKESTT